MRLFFVICVAAVAIAAVVFALRDPAAVGPAATPLSDEIEAPGMADEPRLSAPQATAGTSLPDDETQSGNIEIHPSIPEQLTRPVYSEVSPIESASGAGSEVQTADLAGSGSESAMAQQEPQPNIIQGPGQDVDVDDISAPGHGPYPDSAATDVLPGPGDESVEIDVAGPGAYSLDTRSAEDQPGDGPGENVDPTAVGPGPGHDDPRTPPPSR